VTFEEFTRYEAQTFRNFLDKHVIDDFLAPPGSYGYSRVYTCDCGFRSRDTRTIYHHVCPATEAAP